MYESGNHWVVESLVRPIFDPGGALGGSQQFTERFLDAVPNHTTFSPG